MLNIARGRFPIRPLFLLAAPMLTLVPGVMLGQNPVGAQASPYDQPLAWLYEGQKFHSRLRDYTCTMVKQERIRGKLQEENVLLMKFRNVPFSVYMKWLAPRSMVKQEVCFVYGQNNNKLRVHAPGFVGLAGWVSLDPRDPKVMDQSRHTIYEAGVGKLAERYIDEFRKGKQVNKSRVQVAEYDFQNRRCYRVEVVHTERVPQAYSYRNVLYLDKEWHLPVRTESYDWPRQGGSAEGDLLEVYSFVNFQFNVGLSDNDFRY